MLAFMLSLLSAVRQFSLWQKFATVPWKLVALGVAGAILILLTRHYLHLQEKANQLDTLITQVASTNALNDKIHTIGLDLTEGNNEYRKRTKKLDAAVPTGPVIDNDSVQRISARIAASRGLNDTGPTE